MRRPGETEAGNAREPCRGITRWAHRVDAVGGVRAPWLYAPVPPTQAPMASNDRPPCLEYSRRAAVEYGNLPKLATLHFTLNQDGMSAVPGRFHRWVGRTSNQLSTPMLKEWVAHHHKGRPHSSLGPGIPEPRKGISVPENHSHRIPCGHRIVASGVLAG